MRIVHEGRFWELSMQAAGAGTYRVLGPGGEEVGVVTVGEASPVVAKPVAVAVIEARAAICETCEHKGTGVKRLPLGVVTVDCQRCTGCAGKKSLKNGYCPLKKWSDVL